jgi:hypothetical protein
LKNSVEKPSDPGDLLLRSRVQWIEEGEKPTKYFCGLESKNFTSKIIPKIERDDGKTITKQFDILKETKKQLTINSEMKIIVRNFMYILKVINQGTILFFNL